MTTGASRGEHRQATFTNELGDGMVSRTCSTPLQTGIRSGWGRYVHGCTVKLTYPADVTGCTATSWSMVETEEERGHRVTLNARMRKFKADMEVAQSHDVSCEGSDSCTAEDEMAIGRGQTASTQCNGVRENISGNRAKVVCDLDWTSPGFVDT